MPGMTRHSAISTSSNVWQLQSSTTTLCGRSALGLTSWSRSRSGRVMVGVVSATGSAMNASIDSAFVRELAEKLCTHAHEGDTDDLVRGLVITQNHTIADIDAHSWARRAK